MKKTSLFAVSGKNDFDLRQLTVILLSIVACCCLALILFRLLPERKVGPTILFLLVAAFVGAILAKIRRSAKVQ